MYKCDFCGVSIQTIQQGWVYQTNPGIILDSDFPVGMIDDGAWLACDDCSLLISKEDHKGLEERAVSIYIKFFKTDIPENDVRKVIHTSHKGFWKNKKEEGRDV